jgi:P-type Na+/K+ transporter
MSSSGKLQPMKSFLGYGLTRHDSDLKALEALGGVTAICSDKTGTLTQGAMIVKRVWLASSELLTVRETEDPNDPTMGKVTTSSSDAARAQTDEHSEKRALTFDLPERGRTRQSRSKPEDPVAEKTPELEAFLLSSALCNIAHLHRDDVSNQWSSTGEPTEIALQVFAHRFDFGKKTLQAQGWAQIAEFPFDSSIKRMSVVYNAPQGSEAPILDGDNSVVFTKGAVERVLDLCSQVGIGGSQRPMTEEGKEKILAEMTSLASKGLRVLAVACKNWDGKYNRQKSDDQAEEDMHRSLVESNLTLLGLAGIYDPPRTETKASLAECAAAGIRVHMLTGDHFETAAAIAKEIRIIPDDLSVMSPSFAKNCVMKATDFDKMTDQEIDELPELPLVLARCAPSTKTRMIDALHRRDGFVAMTGDGVNDAPSLSRADVGIAMGSGSDVAKSAAKIVLTDDKFDSIVAAIRTGRRLFDNIQKFMLHLLASNVGEVILLIAGLGFRDTSGQSVFPISPLHILLINVATSSFPAFGLSYERAAHNIMKKQPNDKRKGVFTSQIIADMLIYGLLMGIPNLMTFVIIVYAVGDGGLGVDCNRAYSDVCSTVFRARGAIYVELTWMILFSAWEYKSIRRSLLRLNPGAKSKSALFKDLWENRFLFWAVVLAVLSVFPVLYIPTLNTKVFKHKGIGWEWGIVVPFVLFFLFGIESWKFVKRRMGWFEDRQVLRQNWEQGEEDADEKKLRRPLTFGSLKSWSRSFSKSRRSASRGARSEHDGVGAADRV